MWLKCFLLFLICTTSLHAQLEDYFKACSNKNNDEHALKNIDFIYVINLDQRPEKFSKCSAQLAPYGIVPYRFSAVNGWELNLETINKVGVIFDESMKGGFWGTSYLQDDFEADHEIISEIGRTYFCHCMSRGAIGIYLSHLSVLQDAYDSGYETIWVMEDDIQVLKDPHILSELIDKLDARVGKENWDILYTDMDTRDDEGNYVPCYGAAQRPNFQPSSYEQYFTREVVNGTFRKIGARFGAYSMILRRSGIKKILNFAKVHKIFLPYDLEYYLPCGINIYTVLDDVIIHSRYAESDNGVPNYLERGR